MFKSLKLYLNLYKEREKKKTTLNRKQNVLIRFIDSWDSPDKIQCTYRLTTETIIVIILIDNSTASFDIDALLLWFICIFFSLMVVCLSLVFKRVKHVTKRPMFLCFCFKISTSVWILIKRCIVKNLLLIFWNKPDIIIFFKYFLLFNRPLHFCVMEEYSTQLHKITARSRIG